MDKDHIERRLRTSAMVDGEVSPEEARQWLQDWSRDERAREDWHTFHLIGDVLRSDEMARTASHDQALLQRVQQALQAEPVVIGPPVRAPRPRRRLWAATAAVVAGFMLVGGAVVVSRVDSGASNWGSELLSLGPALSAPPSTSDDLRRASVQFGAGTASGMGVGVGAGVESAPWALRTPVAGFREILRLPRGPAHQPMQSVQVLYSDGSATISVQIEPFRPGEHVPKSESGSRLNALSVQRDGVWLTLMGDVPLATLSQIASSMQAAP